jgi:hypothetical protein
VIDLAKRRGWSPTPSVAAVGAALIVMTLAYLGLWTLGRQLLRMGVEDEQWTHGLSVILGMVGWTLGLLVSGFPSVLRSGVERYRQVAAPAPAAPSPAPAAVTAPPSPPAPGPA